MSEPLDAAPERKSNAAIEPQERIDAAIEAMLGRPIRDSEGLGLTMVPDFLGLRTHADHKKLTRKISKLEALYRAAASVVDAWYEAKDECADELAQLDARNDPRIRPGKELTAWNVISLGGRTHFAFCSAHLLAAGLARTLDDLRSEKRAFGHGPGAKKNLKAYHVADMLARLYLRDKKERPTFGTAYNGQPSTAYARALEEVFSALGMLGTQVRGPAEAAIQGISDADVAKAKEAGRPPHPFEPFIRAMKASGRIKG